MKRIKLTSGFYQIAGEHHDMSGRDFWLAKPFTQGAAGGYITVDGTEYDDLPDRNVRIKCNSEADYIMSKVQDLPDQTDEEIIERLRSRFEMLTDMTKAVKRGDITAMIVSGPPGVGKSHGIEEVLERYKVLENLGGERKYEVIKGALSPIGLYCKLYKYAAKDNVLVFDDCDGIFEEPLALNILKAALDSKKNRTIHWNTDSYKLRKEDVPDSFRFEGSCIFVTNIKFDHIKSKKLRDHLEALESRCHYIDLTIDTDREKMLRIRQVVQDGMLNVYGFTDEQKEEIIQFVSDNKSSLRELSLRTVIKTADLVKAFPDRWQAMAENSLFLRKRQK